ncbi:uncharacterized protein B0H64DRAFT_449531 [Chaetomium fimeti]|uniref:Uncharacterized protein n=1 Tax=Chaetomium fimeti TaxID=1854472 RepID=A0AAE0HSE1_9PEZI|nr:hypothetical protein B0H64DRAFT_449531 [Chaetomium fimeti]
MAASIPLPLKAQVPVTPPAEFQTFMNRPPPQPFTQGAVHHQTSSTLPNDGKSPQPAQPSPTSDTPNAANSMPLNAFLFPDNININKILHHHSHQHQHPQQHHKAPTIPNPHPNPGPQPTAAAAPAAAAPSPSPPAATAPPPGIDPRYLAMASRMASFYQQRAEAVAAAQHRRCQAWADEEQSKRRQAVMQAATVMIAWYVRDRLVRRRKRRRRRFQRGLAARGGIAAGGGVIGGGVGDFWGRRVAKGEAVRRWVMGAAGGGRSGGGDGLGRQLPVDKEEVDFDMDREVPVDKDAHLLEVTGNIIKNHLAGTEVPLLGALSFDESDSDSESEEEEDEFMGYEDEEEGYGEEADYEEDYQEDGEGGEVDGGKVVKNESKGQGHGAGQGEPVSPLKDAA